MCVDVVEKALVEIFLGHGSLPGAAVQRRDDLIAVRTRVPLQFFNGIPRSVLTAENADERVREMVAWYRETGTPFRWWITPSGSLCRGPGASRHRVKRPGRPSSGR